MTLAACCSALMGLIIFAALPAWCCATELTSPDGAIRLRVQLHERGQRSQAAYSVTRNGNPVIQPSTISFLMSDGDVVGDHLVLISAEAPKERRGIWKPLYGERSEVEDSCNEIALDFHDAEANRDLRIEFRCYNAGVAFRAVVGGRDGSRHVSIKEERSEFRFAADHVCWSTTNAQGEYSEKNIGGLGEQVERPLVVRVDDGTYAAIAEAKLVDYARMKLRRSEESPHCVVSQLSGGVQLQAPAATPWRVIMLGDGPGSLLENNDLVLNLNDPCAIADTSWIRPGKVLREVTLSDAGGRACIDFAARNNFQYVEFDAGWYGHEYDDASDATTITPDPKRSPGELDLRGLIRYADQRGIGVILYVNRRALERQLDDILPLYKSWGVAGVKYGFVNVGTQEWTAWLHEAVRKAAEHELMVDIHDEYRPTGYSRTYPNLMTQEGVRGDEATPSAEQTLTTLFTRCVAGASDFTICYFDDRVQEHWSHAHQLAKAVCFYSPWQFVFWYDSPLPGGKNGDGGNALVETPELEFFRRVPTTWDETRVLSGGIGEHAVIARRSGEDWFLGALNSSAPRSVRVSLDFLDAERDYLARTYRDEPSADNRSAGDERRVAIDSSTVRSTETLDIAMAENGGQAIHFSPTKGRAPDAAAGVGR